MVEAYKPANELHNCGGDDHITAFPRHQELMMLLLKTKQLSAMKFASSFTPKSAFGITFRNYVKRLLRIQFIANLSPAAPYAITSNFLITDFRLLACLPE